MRHPNYRTLTQSEIDALENHPISDRQFWERYGAAPEAVCGSDPEGAEQGEEAGNAEAGA